jgi:ionotropic glutamate receptor NMDA 1
LVRKKKRKAILIEYYLIDLGVFLLVAGGIFAGFFLLAIEIAFKRRKEKQEKEIELSRNALVHWRKSIEVNNSFVFFLNLFLNSRNEENVR